MVETDEVYSCLFDGEYWAGFHGVNEFTRDYETSRAAPANLRRFHGLRDGPPRMGDWGGDGEEGK